jgi:hypothetical protein
MLISRPDTGKNELWRKAGNDNMMNDNPSLGVCMHCTVCTVRVSSSDAAPVQVIRM